MHLPVLLNEVMEAVQPAPGKFVIDGTLGGGGHAEAVMKRLKPDGIFLGIDWDKESIKNLVRQLADRIKNLEPRLKKIVIRAGNYADLPEILKQERLGKADGLIIDLGFSSDHLASGRGFSFSEDEPLVMTYDLDRLPVSKILKQLKKSELEKIIRDFSDERYAGRIAREIWEEERRQSIMTSGTLREVISRAVPKNYERGRINPATRTFMALRIYANQELENIERLIQGLGEILKPGGRVAIISFHSIEDRVVKNYFKLLAKEGRLKIITKKPIVPEEKEIKENPKSRSAKLRIGELI